MSEHFPGQERENNTADTENYPIEAGEIDGREAIGQRNAEALKAQHLQNAAEILKRVVGEFSRDGESNMISKSTREHVGTLIIKAHAEVQTTLGVGDPQEELMGVYRRLGKLCDQSKNGDLIEYFNDKHALMFLVMNEVDDLERLIKPPVPTESSVGTPVSPEATRRPKPSRWKRFF